IHQTNGKVLRRQLPDDQEPVESHRQSAAAGGNRRRRGHACSGQRRADETRTRRTDRARSARAAQKGVAMSDDRRRILDLLAQKKITVEEADQLLGAIDAPRSEAPTGEGPKYFRIAIAKAALGWKPEKLVNIRVPIALVKSGMRLGAVIPGFAGDELTRRLRERGIALDLGKLDE